MAAVPEWPISTVSCAALERTISSFDTVSRVPFELVVSMPARAESFGEAVQLVGITYRF
jgi:hypothetical protein